MYYFKAAILLFTILSLNACMGIAEDPLDNHVFSVSQNSASLTEHMGNHFNPTVTIPASVTNTSSPVYLKLDSNSTSRIKTINQLLMNGVIALYLEQPANLTPGKHVEKAIIHACPDTDCVSEFANSPQIITINYEVTAPEFTVSAHQVTFHMAEKHSLPDAITIDMKSSERITLGSSLSYDQGSPLDFWLNIDSHWDYPTGTTIFSINKSLPAGTYNAVLDLYPYNPKVSQTINIRLIVDPLPIAVSQDEFQIDINALQALEQKIPVTIKSILDKPINWIVQPNIDWINVSRSSGNTNETQSLELSINTNIFKLDTGKQTGTVTLRDAAGELPDTVITIKANLEKPEISAIAPIVGYENESQIINLYSKNAKSIIDLIRIDGQLPDNLHVVNDQQIRIKMPAKTAGEYKIALATPQEYPGSYSLYTIVPHTQFEKAHIPIDALYTENPIFDNKRNAIYALTANEFPADTKLIRLMYKNANWKTDSIDLNDCNMNGRSISPDLQKLVVLCQRDKATLIDLNAFKIVGNLNLAIPFSYSAYSDISFITNRELLAVNGENIISIDINNTPASSAPTNNNLSIASDSRFLVSPDLSSIYLWCYNAAYHCALHYDRATKLVTPINKYLYFNTQSISTDGSKILSNGTLMDQDLNEIGQLTHNGIISNTGKYSWGIDPNSTGSTFNMTTYMLDTKNAGGEFKFFITPVTLPEKAEVSQRILSSQDDHTLFIISNKGLTVQPIPQ